MAKVDVVCPQCNETHAVRCNGHSASGAQRYICKHCSKTFQLNFRLLRCQTRHTPDHC
ncbi:IS1 family transposase [Erwinia tracheiphila]|uniref:IS1/IS1595 family N-terminal zinc-binding domain-containing protein n=1 Tax=Erwinia tracheiphila TaxID=65700 RepID=UPI0022860795|nr:IS1 family transposase [Erwinia tracheiphila]